MSAKEEIVQIALSTEDDILILDPESEFGYLTEALGGEVIRISATSDTHINALDMDRAYGDERNPIVSKSEFVLSLFEQLIGDGMVTAKEKLDPRSLHRTGVSAVYPQRLQGYAAHAAGLLPSAPNAAGTRSAGAGAVV